MKLLVMQHRSKNVVGPIKENFSKNLIFQQNFGRMFDVNWYICDIRSESRAVGCCNILFRRLTLGSLLCLEAFEKTHK
jgi:hypothetical protein